MEIGDKVMLRFLLAAALLVWALTGVKAASIDGLVVKDLGVPACYKPNPMPSTVNGGTFYARLPALDGNLHGTTDPWAQWPLAKFRGATYSALYAQSFSTGAAVYDFPAAQTGMTVVIGTPDAGESIVFKRGVNPVARLDMADVLATFGFRNGIYVSIKMPAGVAFDRAVFAQLFEGAALEYADLNAACR